jgi:hypothetical protein
MISLVGASDLLDCWLSGSLLKAFALGSEAYAFFHFASPLLARFEALCLPFLAKIWHQRASLLKGVP